MSWNQSPLACSICLWASVHNFRISLFIFINGMHRFEVCKVFFFLAKGIIISFKICDYSPFISLSSHSFHHTPSLPLFFLLSIPSSCHSLLSAENFFGSIFWELRLIVFVDSLQFLLVFIFVFLSSIFMLLFVGLSHFDLLFFFQFLW